MEQLRLREIEEGLIRLIASYLFEREIILENGEETRAVSTSSGVAQSSVVGSTLWNILYDELLRKKMPQDTYLIGFTNGSHSKNRSGTDEHTKHRDIVIN